MCGIAEALALSRQAHDARGVHVGLSNLGSLAAQEGLFDEALPLLRESVALTHEALDLYGVADQLLHLAWVAAKQQESEHAAVLLGGSQTLYEAIEQTLEPVAQQIHTRTMSTLRRDLEPDRLAKLLDQGKAMTIDEIVAYAIAPDRGA